MKETNNKNKFLIGTWAWGTGYNGSSMVFGKKQDENVLRDTFNLAVEEGFLKWDTAAVYGMGSCEKLLGNLIISKIEEEAMKTGIRQQGSWEPQ